MGALMVISVQVLRGADGQTRLAYLPRKGGLPRSAATMMAGSALA
jgi:hypothetical protein